MTAFQFGLSWHLSHHVKASARLSRVMIPRLDLPRPLLPAAFHIWATMRPKSRHAWRIKRVAGEARGEGHLEDAEVVAELADEGVALVWVVFRLHLDGPVKALQPLPRDACTHSHRFVNHDPVLRIFVCSSTHSQILVNHCPDSIPTGLTEAGAVSQGRVAEWLRHLTEVIILDHCSQASCTMHQTSEDQLVA